MERSRGERNWEEVVGDYEVHTPTPIHALEHTEISDDDPIIWINDEPYVRAADGKLEPL